MKPCGCCVYPTSRGTHLPWLHFPESGKDLFADCAPPAATPSTFHRWTGMLPPPPPRAPHSSTISTRWLFHQRSVAFWPLAEKPHEFHTWNVFFWNIAHVIYMIPHEPMISHVEFSWYHILSHVWSWYIRMSDYLCVCRLHMWQQKTISVESCKSHEVSQKHMRNVFFSIMIC